MRALWLTRRLSGVRDQKSYGQYQSEHEGDREVDRECRREPVGYGTGSGPLQLHALRLGASRAVRLSDTGHLAEGVRALGQRHERMFGLVV
jgi:hypothetical protein